MRTTRSKFLHIFHGKLLVFLWNRFVFQLSQWPRILFPQKASKHGIYQTMNNLWDFMGKIRSLIRFLFHLQIVALIKKWQSIWSRNKRAQTPSVGWYIWKKADTIDILSIDIDISFDQYQSDIRFHFNRKTKSEMISLHSSNKYEDDSNIHQKKKSSLQSTASARPEPIAALRRHIPASILTDRPQSSHTLRIWYIFQTHYVTLHLNSGHFRVLLYSQTMK